METNYPAKTVEADVHIMADENARKAAFQALQDLKHPPGAIVWLKHTLHETMWTPYGEVLLTRPLMQWYFKKEPVRLPQLMLELGPYREYLVSRTQFFIHQMRNHEMYPSMPETDRNYYEQRLQQLEDDLTAIGVAV